MPPVSPPAGWTKGLQIEIPSSQIPNNNTNVPIVLTASAFTTTFLNSLQSDGADLRFTSDDAGTTFLARDIQHFDQVAGEIIVHVKLDSVSSSSNKIFYAWANNSTAIEPPPRDPSGFQSTWNDVLGGSSYYGVCHFQDAPDSGQLFPISDPGFKAGTESSGNWTAVNAGSGITQATSGPLPGQTGWELANSNNIINLEAINSQNNDNTIAHYLEFWIDFNGSFPNSNAPIFVGDFNRFWKFNNNGQLKMGDNGNSSSSPSSANGFHQMVMTRTSGGAVTFYIDGQPAGTTTTTQDIETMNRMFMDRNNNGNGYSGKSVYWWRVCRGVTLGVDHLELQWNSVTNYLTFASASNETDFNPTVPVTVTVVDLSTGSPVENTRVRLLTSPGNVEIMNGLTDSSGELTINYSNTTPQAITGVARKASLPGTRYKQGPIAGTITSNGFATTIQLISDES